MKKLFILYLYTHDMDKYTSREVNRDGGGKNNTIVQNIIFKRRKVRREITAKLQTQQEFQKPKTGKTMGEKLIIKK